MFRRRGDLGGDFHGGLNFAGCSGPVVFLGENNGWAISLPCERQTAIDTIAGKARAYGFDGMRVDGDDPIAIREATERALSGPVPASPS